MLSIKINNRIKIQEFNNGIKLFIKLDNNNWKCLKFNKNESNLLYCTLKYLKE